MPMCMNCGWSPMEMEEGDKMNPKKTGKRKESVVK